jgi:ubiquinone/menaquinone biosynthesis C-methylase UbiE
MKVNIGCGKNKIPNWINIDKSVNIKPDIISEANSLPFKNNSCEIIYASHILEYFDWEEAKNVILPEWYRILKDSGIIRLAVPDFFSISKLYQAGFDLSFFIGPLYGKINLNNEKIYHKCAYDENILTNLLVKCGFKNIRRWNWKEVEHKNIDDQSRAYFPHMDFERGILISLNLEAEK